MGRIKPEQFMVAYNQELGVVYATQKGKVKTTTPGHARAIKGCLEQYFEGKLSGSDREKLECYMEDSFRNMKDLPIEIVPNIMERKVLRRIELLVANECNLNCKYCYAHGGDYGIKSKRMLPEEAEMYLQELLIGKYSYVEIVTFFGGEPTLCPDTIRRVCEFFESCVKNGTFEKMPIFLMVSNGTLIDETMAEMIHRFKIGVTVSVDGPAEITDLLRVDMAGKGAFLRASQGIENLLNVGSPPILLEATYTARHKELGYTKEGIRNYLVDHFHVKNVMVADCTSGGMDEQLAYTDWDIHTGENGEMMTEEVRYAVDCLRQTEISPIGCDACFGSILIMPNGDIYPCHSFVGHFEYRMACFQEGHFDFADYEKVLQKFINLNKFQNSRCTDCWAKAVCLFCPAGILLKKDTESVSANCHTRREAQRYAILKCAESGLKRKKERGGESDVTGSVKSGVDYA